MERIYLQGLVFFADTFANGFVREKRTHFGGCLGGEMRGLQPKAPTPLSLQGGDRCEGRKDATERVPPYDPPPRRLQGGGLLVMIGDV